MLGGQGLLHVPHGLTVAGHAKIVSLLQDGPRFRHRAEDPGTGSLARIPVALALFIFQVELRIAVPRHPHAPRGNSDRAAHGHKQRREFLAVADSIVECLSSALDLAVKSVFDFRADPIEDRFGLFPRSCLCRSRLAEPTRESRDRRFRYTGSG